MSRILLQVITNDFGTSDVAVLANGTILLAEVGALGGRLLCGLGPGGGMLPAQAAPCLIGAGPATDDTCCPAGPALLLQTSASLVCRLDAAACTPVAGTIGEAGLSGDNGPASSATLNAPADVVPDPKNSSRYYIVDTANHRIRLVDSGVIRTVAGTTKGYSGDNATATAAQLNAPTAMAFDASGNYFVADTNNSCIR